MKIKKKSKLTIAILTIIAIYVLLPIIFETYNVTSDDSLMNSPKISNSVTWITISRPNNLSSWGTSAGEWIYWDSTDDIFMVNITLYNNGTYVLTIDAYAPNTHAIIWNIPAEMEESTLYQIKIANTVNLSTYDISPFFYIYPSTPGKGAIQLGAAAPIIVLAGFGLFILACIITKVVKKIVINRRKE